MARQIRKPRYHPSTLVLIRRKYYVSVTKPKELQFGKDKQSRRSTGTSDKRQAEKLQHELTQQIYEEFDRLLERYDPVFELLRPEFEKAGLPVLDWYRKGEMSAVIKTGRLEETWTAETQRDLCALAIQLKHPIPYKAFSLLSESDREWLQSAVKPSNVPVDLTLRVAALEKDLPGVPRRLLEMSGGATVVGSEEVTVENPDAPTLHDLLPAFLKTRTEKQQRVDRIQLNKWINHPTFGKKPLKAVEKFDAYEFLEEQGEDLTKSSIKVLRASLSNVYNWLNRKREYGVDHNPYKGLSIGHIGKDGTVKRPLYPEELEALFKLDMPENVRLAFIILATTGMRDGNVVDLEPRHYRVSEEGIRHFDIRFDTDTKTEGTKAIIPLHDIVPDLSNKLPLNVSADVLNSYIDKVNDAKEVSVHSLRHTWKDRARDAEVPKDIQDFMSGHKRGDVASGYGEGPSISTRYRNTMKIKYPFIKP